MLIDNYPPFAFQFVLIPYGGNKATISSGEMSAFPYLKILVWF